MPSLEDVVTAFLGRRVRIWTRFLEEPTEGKMIFFSFKQPYLILIKTDNGKYVICNWKEVVRVDCLDETTI